MNALRLSAAAMVCVAIVVGAGDLAFGRPDMAIVAAVFAFINLFIFARVP